MDVEVSQPPFEESLQIAEELFVSKNNEDIADEEEEVFYDAGEEVTEHSSDITPPDIKFSVANEDLPTDSSDRSEVDAFDSPIRPKKVEVVPLLGNLDDISTEASSSVEESGSPQVRKIFSLYDADDVTGENSRQPLTWGKNVNIENLSSDVASGPIGKSRGIEKSNNDKDGTENESLDDCIIAIDSSPSSSMEVMDDGSVENSTKIEPQAVSESLLNKNVHSDTNRDEIAGRSLAAGSAENVGKKRTVNTGESCETITCVNSEKPEVNEKTSDAGEILTMDDDSDVDESFQENLHVALKVVEESSLLSPTDTDSKPEEADSPETTDDDTNKIENVSQPIEIGSKAENILQEFRNDAAQLNNGNIETIDGQQCLCKVVLFKIDFDKKALQCHKNGAGTSQSPIVGASDSDSDSLFSRSVKTSRPLRPKRPRSVVKPTKKNRMSSSESEHEILSLGTRSSRVLSSTSESSPIVKDRSTRKFNKATNSIPVKNTRISPSSSDMDDVPLTQMRSNKKRKLALNHDHVSTSKGKKMSNKSVVVEKIVEKPSRATKYAALVDGDDEIKTNSKKSRRGEVSRQKILKCVSLPIITGIVKSLKENSYQELLELMAEKANKLSSPTGSVSQSDVNLPGGRRSRRRKLSSSDLSESSVDDSEYKVYSKLWKYDSGRSEDDTSPAVRATSKSFPLKKSLREKTKTPCYAEDSESNSEVEISLKRAEKSKKPSSPVKRNLKKSADSNGAEVEQASNETDNRYSRRRIPQLRSRARV